MKDLMVIQIKSLRFIGLLWFFLLSTVNAQNLPNLHFQVVSIHETVEFKSDKLMTITTRAVREALTEQGAQQLTKHTYGFNGALESIELMEAYTLKKSGEKIPLAFEGLTKQKGHVSSGVGVTMPEWEAHQIAFPSIGVGDKTFIHTRRIIQRAPLEGWLSYSDFLWPAVEIQKAQWKIIAPENLALTVKSTLIGSAEPRIAQGVKTWEFEASSPAKAIDNAPTSTRVSVAYLAASTIAQHEAVATLFAKQVQAKAIATDDIRALATQITQGLTDDASKAKAIYNWIRRNVKYAAIYLSNGGWEPHDAAHILRTRYGDCKDHVTLMYALLAQSGVEANPVLINTSTEYVADPIPVAGSYNHTILYLPKLDLYLDPTAHQTPYGVMTYGLHGRPVAYSDGKQGQVGRTPVIQAHENTSTVYTTVTVVADGSANMEIEHIRTGLSAMAAHDQLANYRREFEATEVRNLLSRAGYSGTGRFTHTPVNRDVLEHTNSWNLRIRNFFPDPMAGSITVHPGLDIQTHIAQIMGNYAQDKREFSSQCGSFKVRENFHIRFDPKFNILRVPKAIKLNEPGIQFASQIERSGNVIQGHRNMEYTNDSAECTPAEYVRRRETMLQILRHTRSPLLFMQPE